MVSVQAAEAAEQPVRVALADPLDGAHAAEATRRLEEEAARGRGPVEVDLGAVARADLFGLAALGAALRRLRAEGRPARVVGAREEVLRLGRSVRIDDVLTAEPSPPPALGRLERMGDRVLRGGDTAVAFLAMLALGCRDALAYPLRGPVAREQLWRQLALVGSRAVPIVLLINFTIGAILAIQMAYVARAYGAVVFVPSFVAISITREIGPLLTAIIVAARSGSAIAAELGVMKITEEVDALEMMALDPRRFLLLPRFIALALAVPALNMFADVAGLLGGSVVGVTQYDFSWRGYWDDTVSALVLRDVLSGVVKSFFFGILVAVVACLEGLRIRGGPEAVGTAATRAVVHAIIAVILFDAVFTYLTKEVL